MPIVFQESMCHRRLRVRLWPLVLRADFNEVTCGYACSPLLMLFCLDLIHRMFASGHM